MSKVSSEPSSAKLQSSNAEDQLASFARRLLLPIARVLVGRLPFEALSRMIRDCMIQAAQEKIAREQPAKRITKSAVALMVGIDGRSIRELDEPDDMPNDQSFPDPIGTLLEVWSRDPEWRDPETEKPRDLSPYGNGHTFQRLVRQVIGRSISYSELMEILLRHGNIERIGKRDLRLVDDKFKQKETWVVAESGLLPFLGDMVYCLGLNIQQCLDNPLRTTNDSRTTGLIAVNSIPAANIPALRHAVSELLVRQSQDLEEIVEHYQDLDTGDQKFTAGAGLFYWEEPQARDSYTMSFSG